MKLLRARYGWHSLVARCLTGSAMVMGLAVLGSSLLLLIAGHSAFHREIRLRGEQLATFMAAQSQLAVLVDDRQELRRVAESALAADDVLYVAFTDASGHTLTEARRPGWIQSSDLLEISRPVEAPASATVLGGDQPAAAGQLGFVRVGLSRDEETELFHKAIWYTAAVVAAALLLILTVQLWHLRRLFSPVEELAEFTTRVASGAWSERARIVRKDEVGELAAAFNRMIDRLSATTVSRNYVDDIIQSMRETLIVVGVDGKIDRFNGPTLELLGFRENELAGAPVSKICADFASGMNASGRETVYRAASGVEIPVLLSSSPLRGRDGDLQGTVLVARDMTDRKRVERELLRAKDAAEQASAAKSMFLANMSHEFRTPLNAILGYTQLLSIELGDHGLADLIDDLHKIERAGQHLLRLISNVLDLSRIEAGRFSIHPQEFDLGVVIRDVVEIIEPMARRNHNQMRTDYRSMRVWGDRTRVQQSLLNLASNACKFTQDGLVSIKVETNERSGGKWYSVRVADSGIGIAPEHMSKLFRAFSQVDSSTTRQFEGSGLGLALSRKLCRMMGGDIVAESEPGRGSAFTMIMPVHAAVAEEQHEPTGEQAWAQS